MSLIIPGDIKWHKSLFQGTLIERLAEKLKELDADLKENERLIKRCSECNIIMFAWIYFYLFEVLSIKITVGSDKFAF